VVIATGDAVGVGELRDGLDGAIAGVGVAAPGVVALEIASGEAGAVFALESLVDGDVPLPQLLKLSKPLQPITIKVGVSQGNRFVMRQPSVLKTC
jgi:hypothetical protein